MRVNAGLGAVICLVGLVAIAPQPARAAVEQVPLKNATFSEGADANGVPGGWQQYAGGSAQTRLKVVQVEGGAQALQIEDDDTQREIGVVQSVPVTPGVTYRATVSVKPPAGASTGGAILLLHFEPMGKQYVVGLSNDDPDKWVDYSIVGTAPAGATKALIYIYGYAEPTPKVMVRSVKLESGLPAPPPPPPPPPPLPEPIPPQYEKLKDLHQTIPLVEGGQAASSIVAPASGVYQQAAATIQQAILKLVGVKVPIIADSSPAAVLPLKGNVIVLGNRSTNRTSGALYDLYYSLMDLKYPGPGGYAIRTLHDPFGDGYSAVLVGGSDTAGVNEAAALFARKLGSVPAAKGQLAVGWLMETKLASGYSLPADMKLVPTWEDSAGYGSTGYFGWSSIAKRMAMYYMTGDENSAREFLRLSFPDAQAIKEIEDVDGERIENKHDPLAGFYHYNAHMAILYWDLIEESPFFTDEQRLRVTNAFSRQLNHRKGEGVYTLQALPPYMYGRHGQYAAISLYCLGRYFEKYYPNPIWAQCVKGSEFAYAPLEKTDWNAGCDDCLFWYDTGTAPILTFTILTNNRKALETGMLQKVLRGHEMLISGRVPDWALGSSALDYLNKAVYLTGDGRWLTYRERTRTDTSIFRLGQSFWPEASVKPVPPGDLVGKWSLRFLPEGQWRERGSGLPLEQSLDFGSWRSAPDASGDFVLLDGYNGASRDLYYTYAIMELRLAGRTLLQGYGTRVTTSADGMVEPQVALDGGLVHAEVVGPTALAVGDVPKMAFCDWRRTLAQRTGRYALIVDDLTFRTDSANMKVKTEWQTVGGSWDDQQQAIRASGGGSFAPLPGWLRFRALDAHCTSNLTADLSLVPLESIGILLLRPFAPGGWMDLPFKLDRPFEGEAYVELINYVDRGMVRISVDGQRVGEDYDHYAPAVTEARVPLGAMKLAAGEHHLRLEAVGPHPGLDKFFIGVAGLSLRPNGAPPADALPTFELRPSNVQATRGAGMVAMEWSGPVKPGQHRFSFYLLGQSTADAGHTLACLQVADNAAALNLPQPALAVAGDYGGSRGELVLLAADHLVGQGLLQAGTERPLLTSDQPVDVDWDFISGVAHVVNTKPVALALAAEGKLQVDGKPVAAPASAGVARVQLAAGRHVIGGARVSEATLGKLRGELEALLAEGQQRRATELAVVNQPVQPLTAAPLPAAATAQVGGTVVDLVSIPSAGGPLVAAAEGKAIHMLTPEGREVRRMETDGAIRILRWWAETKLLLAGCVDEKVIAFDESGQRAWVFVSQMDPAVYEAAKTYWFKSQPGHEGIHGLFTGPFQDGKSQCFVGSACTLEILDEKGQLVKRLPIFWGPGSKFQIIDAADGSKNLIMAQWPNGYDYPATVNSKTMAQAASGFNGVPSGHTFVNGWTAQNHGHFFYVDLYGDGKKEVVCDQNGSWNRVTVYSAAGAPLYNAQFGPGAIGPAANLRDMDLADLNGDGKLEAMVGTSDGLVVALDGKMSKLWATRPPSPPMVLKAVGKTLVVGCEDGTVLTMDGAGGVTRLGQVNGKATTIEAVRANARPVGPLVIIGTAAGEVAGFAVP